MKLSTALTLALATTTLYANSDNSDLHQYTIEQFAANLDACENARSSIESRFTTISGFKALGSTCSQNLAKTYNIDIEYVANGQKPVLVSTFHDSPLSHGLYATRDECLANATSELQEFETNTGLKPIVSFCFKNYHQQYNDLSWTLRIDSFGTPKKNHFQIRNHFFGNIPTSDAPEQRRVLSSYIASLGGTNPRAGISQAPYDTFLVASYYAEKPLPIKQYEFGLVDSIADCQAVKMRMQDIFTKADGTAGLSLCIKKEIGRGYDVFVLGSTKGSIASKESGLPYANMAACDSQRTAIEQKWRDALGLNILGSICTMEHLVTDVRIEMRLFWLE